MTAQNQHAYYTRTAAGYADAHMQPGDNHYIALEYIAGLIHALRIRSVLDVGAGVGRGSDFLAARLPDIRIFAVEPEEALIRQRPVFPRVVRGSGENLPFDDQSFDAVVATGVLHHVLNPSTVVAEMTRVARFAVFLSDANRFGQGRPIARITKAALHRLGLWDFQVRLRTKGTRAFYSEGDGVSYSYSLFDSRRQLATWADRLFFIPTTNEFPRLESQRMSHAAFLLCGIREPDWFAHPQK